MCHDQNWSYLPAMEDGQQTVNRSVYCIVISDINQLKPIYEILIVADYFLIRDSVFRP